MALSEELLQVIADRLESIDTRLGSVDTRLESVDRRLEAIAEVQKVNTQYLGTISEKLTSLELKVDTRFDQIAQGFEDLKEITRMQGSHIDRLMSITETLIQQRVA